MTRAYERPDRTTRAGTLALVGGALCLDFANTVDWHASAEHQQDYLVAYPDLVAWSQHAGILTEDEAQALLAEAARRPERAAAALARAIALREALYRVFVAVTRGEPAADDGLALLNAAVADALARLRLRPEGDGFGWAWASEGATLERMLWPVARSAAELLTSPRLGRVRQCAGGPCGWLFLDTSKNGSRRWCSMAGCGNRAKARRHYARRRLPERPAPPEPEAR